MLFHAEDLIKEAEKGKQLTIGQRRHCIAYLLGTQPSITNDELAEVFKVNEAMIRKDIKKIREDKAQKLKEDDIKLVIADIVMSFERQVKDIERSKRKAKEGTKDYLEHCKAIFNLEAQKVKLLQDLGFYPKDLGSMTVNSFQFSASIGKGGVIMSGPVDDAIDITPVVTLLEPPSTEFKEEFKEEDE